VTLLNILSFVMSLGYLAAGVFLLVAMNIFYFSTFQQVGLGCILIAYGLFRFYSALKKYREKEMLEDEE
jgi:hypothetical protein